MAQKILAWVYFFFGMISAMVAWDRAQYELHSMDSITVAAGALGFAFLAGVCFFCAAYLLKSNQR